jgi:hypothetical protein
VARYLLEDRSTIPDDGQADATAHTATRLPAALDRARELARDAGRAHGRTAGIVYVWEEGTNNVWSVQWHPEDAITEDEPVLDGDGRPVLDEDGEPQTRTKRTYPVGWRVVHDASFRQPEYGEDEAGRRVVRALPWQGHIEVTDYDDAGNEIPVDDRSTNATRGVTHVPLQASFAEGVRSQASEGGAK